MKPLFWLNFLLIGVCCAMSDSDPGPAPPCESHPQPTKTESNLTFVFQTFTSCSGKMRRRFWNAFLGSEIATLALQMCRGVHSPVKADGTQVTARVVHVPCKCRMYCFLGAYDLVRSVLLRLVFVSITLCDHINLSPGAPVPWFSLAVIPAVAASRQGAGTHNDAHIELLVAGICNFLNVFKYVCCPKQIASHLSFTRHISLCVIKYHENIFYFF